MSTRKIYRETGIQCFWQHGWCVCITFQVYHISSVLWELDLIDKPIGVIQLSIHYPTCFWVCTRSHLCRTDCRGIIPRKSAMCDFLIHTYYDFPLQSQKSLRKHRYLNWIFLSYVSLSRSLSRSLWLLLRSLLLLMSLALVSLRPRMD